MPYRNEAAWVFRHQERSAWRLADDPDRFPKQIRRIEFIIAPSETELRRDFFMLALPWAFSRTQTQAGGRPSGVLSQELGCPASQQAVLRKTG